MKSINYTIVIVIMTTPTSTAPSNFTPEEKFNILSGYLSRKNAEFYGDKFADAWMNIKKIDPMPDDVVYENINDDPEVKKNNNIVNIIKKRS